MKRIISFMLAFVMVLGMMPVGDMVVFAAGEVKVKKITVTKFVGDHENRDSAYYSVIIEGDNLEGVGIGVRPTKAGSQIEPGKKNPNITNEFIAPASDKYQSTIYVTYKGESMGTIDVGLPSIDSIDPTDKIVDTTDENTNSGIKIKASSVPTDIEIARLERGSSNRTLTAAGIGEDKTYTASPAEIKDRSGGWDATFKRKEKKQKIGSLSGAEIGDKTDVHIEIVYPNIFLFRKKLGVSDKINVFPTQGPKGTKVTLTADILLPNISIFLLKDRGDSLKQENMVSNESIKYTPKSGSNQAKIAFEIPETLKELGSHYIVLTNRVNPHGDIDSQIEATKVIEEEESKFIVIDGKDSIKIKEVDPSSGSILGRDATLIGEHIGRVSSNIYSGGERSKIDISNSEKMVVKYTGGIYNNEDVEWIERSIRAQIGGPVKFLSTDEEQFTDILYDKIKIKVPRNSDLTDPVKDVYVETTTIIKYKDKPDVVTGPVTETDTKPNGFTFLETDVSPEIEKLEMDKIPVDSQGRVTKEMVISIKGKEFVVKQKDDKVITPEVSLDEIVGSEELFDNGNIRVYDSNRNLLDGSKDIQGTNIKVTIIPGWKVPSEKIGIPQKLKVRNPYKYDEGMGDYATKDITFIREDSGKVPNIIDVLPKTVVTKGKGGVKIDGTNFRKLTENSIFLDGEKIAVKSSDDKNIIFDAPGRPEGSYQIIVQNDTGEVDTFNDFIYTETYTNPGITGFNPQKGTNGTKVYLSGTQIMQPNPLVKDVNNRIDVYSFIGTRVFLRKTGSDKLQDMNEYNYKPGTEIIELKEYTSKENDDIVKKKDGINRVELSKYYHSVIFENEGTSVNEYYKVFYDSRSGDVKLTDGALDEYTIYYDNGIKAKKAGLAAQVVTATSTHLNIGENLKLRIKTPYIVDNVKKEIVGNKVKVTSNTELEFYVNLNSNNPNDEIKGGMYDVIIENPDTNSYEAKDKFEYIVQPESKPKIEEILATNEGSTKGGYQRRIKGDDFKEGISVYIGIKQIDPKNVTYVSENEIIVEIPTYEGELPTGRKTMPISVLNLDGGSASHDFIYVDPKSEPVIDSIASNFGSVSGGDEVIIYEGKDFRFFEPYIDSTEPKGEWNEGEEFTNVNKNKDSNGKNIYDDLRKKQHRDRLSWEDQLKVLPKIWFGGEKATIIKYDTEGKNSTGKRIITVKVPKGVSGRVPVYLENNDYGVSNVIDFEYKKTDIGNIEIKPGTGRKQGNTSAEIRATGKDKKNVFSPTEFELFKQDGTSSKITRQLVRFSKKDDLNMSNASIDGSMVEAMKESSGRIVNEVANVTVGSLTVDYSKDSDKETMKFKLIDTIYDSKDEEFKDIEYEFAANFPKDVNEVYLPISLLKNDKGNYNGFELVKISKGRFTIDGKLSNVDKLTVERGYSPEAHVKNNGEYIDLKVPSYYTIGEVIVTVINADGSEASTKYIYTNPSNSPVITDVFREGNPTTDKEKASGKKVIKVDYRGGVKIHIMGRDFRKPSRIDIGGSIHVQGEKIGDDKKGIDHFPQVEDREDYEELVFVMPEVPEDYVGKEYAFIVTTPYEDAKEGGNLNSATTSSSDGQFKIYIEFTKGETNPKISGLTPNKGPSSGGTKVTIEGEDFRKQDPAAGMYGELRVRVAGKELDKDKIQFVNSKKIIITTPPNESGEVRIEVENPDGSIAKAEKDGDDKYTYISNPKITNIVDPENGDVKKESLSIEGGETIKIIGSDFQEGAEVIFSPILKKASEDPTSTEKRIFINGVEYIYKPGIAAQLVEFIDSNNIKVVTPAGKLDTGDVIVINKDGAATPIYSLKYTIPEISYPREVRASLINDEYIRINWDEVTDKATADDGKTVQYEVYVIEGNSREFIGTTGTTGFIFRDIKRNKTTEFQFLVRSVGKYGSSKPIEESTSNIVKVSRNAGPVDNDGKPGEKTKVEKIGDTANIVIGEDALKGVSEYVIDLTRGNLAGSEKVVVSISAETVVSERNKKIKIVGKDYGLSFNPNVFENATVIANRNNINAGVKFEVLPTNTNFDLAQNNGDTILASKYYLRGRTFVGANSNEIENLNGVMNFALDYDNSMAKARRLENNIKIVRYDQYARRFEEIRSNSNYGTSLGNISKLGIYTIVGSRR